MKAPSRLTVQRTSEQGFSLIEVAIVVAIIGLLLVPFLMEYNIQEKTRAINTTRANINTAESALRKYALKYGRYPRPANPSTPSDARVTIGGLTFGAGDEQPNQNATPPAPAFPACPGPATPLTSVCIGAGARDTLADADTNDDFVFVGTLPYATIGLTQAQGIDGFGRKLSYTVSAAMTVAPPFNEEFGTIRITDDNPANPNGTAGNSRAHFIVISHGASGVGAYNMRGTRNTPCGDPSVRRDNNNCNYDGFFDDGTVTYNYTDFETGDVKTARDVTRIANGTPQAWDNYYYYTDSVTSDVWIPVANEQNIQSRDVEAVRINSTLEDNRVRVEVGGDVRAPKVYTDNLCRTSSGDDTCVMPAAIGTETEPPYRTSPSTDAPGIRCAAFSAMTGIAGGNEECGNLTASNLGTFTMTPCPSGQFPNGITAAGVVTCSPP